MPGPDENDVLDDDETEDEGESLEELMGEIPKQEGDDPEGMPEMPIPDFCPLREGPCRIDCAWLCNFTQVDPNTGEPVTTSGVCAVTLGVRTANRLTQISEAVATMMSQPIMAQPGATPGGIVLPD